MKVIASIVLLVLAVHANGSIIPFAIQSGTIVTSPAHLITPNGAIVAAPGAVIASTYGHPAVSAISAAPGSVAISASPGIPSATLIAPAIGAPAIAIAQPSASYVAANRGTVHVSELPGHVDSAVSVNLEPAPGTI